MSSYALEQAALNMMERGEADALGIKVTAARSIVARQIGISESTFNDIRRGRVKDLRSSVAQAIDDAVVRWLTRRVEALTHEIEIYRRRGDQRDGRVIRHALDARARIDKFLEEIGREV